MNDYFSGLISPLSFNKLTEQQTSSSSNSTSTTEFCQLLAGLLAEISVTGSSSTTGLSANSMMAPLMLNLLEKLVAGQVESPSTASTPHGLPVQGTLTQSYSSSHKGLDFGVPEGTPIRTTMDGKVIYAGWNDEGYGNLIIVENGANRTYYGHLSEISVTTGQDVKAGSMIGLSGNTGNSTGPHLHYETRVNGVSVDPTENTLNYPEAQT